MKLLELLGIKKFNKLKSALGDNFSKVEELYNSEVTGEDDDVEPSDDVDKVEDKDNKEDSTDTEEDKEDINVDNNIDSVVNKDNNNILSDGWLKEDDTVDLDKILDVGLKEYISKLHKQLDDINNDILVESIKGEARSQGAVEVDDILKFIDVSTVSKDEVGATISKLKEDKGHLFKDATKGFNPASSKSRAKYRQGMSFSDALDMTE